VSEKYAFIAAERAENTAAAVDAPTIAQMVAWLDASKFGYDEWLNRAPSPAHQRREELAIKIKALFDLSSISHMRTELVTDVLVMAARNHVLEPGCVMHSDRGAQYTG
jgi:hypothetical protein